MPSVPTIPLTGQLKYLIAACEKGCVAGCCGIAAFDFTPLHIASHLSTHSRCIPEDTLRKYEGEIAAFEAHILGLDPDADGYLCYVPEMNETFRRGDFLSFLEELRHNLRMAPQVLELSDRLELRRPGSVTMTPQSPTS